VLSCYIYFASLGSFPKLVLNSALVNKHTITVKTHIVGLILNIILDLAVIRLGYGILGIAWVTLGTQGLVTFLQYFLAREYMFSQEREFYTFMVSILFPFFIIILFTISHVVLTSLTVKPFLFVIISLPVQIAVWASVIFLCYRRYFPRDKVIPVIKDFSETISGELRSFFRIMPVR